jgi:tRNA A-37 threonylcarbamoyl transferase component Bud32
VQAVFLQAVNMLADERSAFLDRACEGDSELWKRVDALVKAHDEQGSFLDRPVAVLDLDALPETLSLKENWSPRPALTPGTRIGSYCVLELLGEGGMGTVYVAQQESPIRRRVALKIIKPGMDTARVIARFEQERQALALMDHPNIARVFDADTTETGRPYFVMELVQGVPITRYCDEQHLSIRDRLTLFVTVCQAIQHAHQKGIIHRDIKPSNVLVCQQEGKAVPKIIDFGIAKAMEQKLTDASVETEVGQMLGTLEYMSPEQAEMSPQGVDTRSDIYSLGVLLYELLTGQTPLPHKHLRKLPYLDLLQFIREKEPVTPSAVLRGTDETLVEVAAQRGTQPVSLLRQVRGDLDRIVMKALDKDRARRYETANALALDVMRYLDDEPVLACPPSVGYRLRKWAWRHRTLVWGTVLVTTMVLVASLVLLSVSNVRIAGALQTETEAREELEQVLERERQTLHLLRLSLIRRHWETGKMEQARQVLEECAPDLRDQTWRYLHRVCHAELLSMKNLAKSPSPSYLAYSPDGSRLVVLEGIKGVRVLDARTGQSLVSFTISQPVLVVTALTFSADNQQLIGLTLNKDPKQGAIYEVVVWAIHPQKGLTPIREGKPFPGPRPSYAVLSPDGQRVAVATNTAQEVWVWDAMKSGGVRKLDARPVAIHSLAFSPNSRYLAAASKDKVVKIWEIDTGRLAHTAQGYDHAGLMLHFRSMPWSVSPDGRRFAWGQFGPSNAAADVKMLDVAAKTPVRSWAGHQRGIPILRFSPDGRYLATASEDRLVILWDVATGKEVLTLRGHRRGTHALAFSPDGRRLASGGSDTVRIWDISPLE